MPTHLAASTNIPYRRISRGASLLPLPEVFFDNSGKASLIWDRSIERSTEKYTKWWKNQLTMMLLGKLSRLIYTTYPSPFSSSTAAVPRMNASSSPLENPSAIRLPNERKYVRATVTPGKNIFQIVGGNITDGRKWWVYGESRQKPSLYHSNHIGRAMFYFKL